MTDRASSGTATPQTAAHERERDARRRYAAAIAAAHESLRRAYALFDEYSAAIDAHIRFARALDDAAIRLLQGAGSSISPGAEEVPARTASLGPTLSPVPSRLVA